MSSFFAGLILGAAGVGLIFMVLLTAVVLAGKDQDEDIDIE